MKIKEDSSPTWYLQKALLNVNAFFIKIKQSKIDLSNGIKLFKSTSSKYNEGEKKKKKIERGRRKHREVWQ